MFCHAVFLMFFSGMNFLIANKLRVLIGASSILPVFLCLFPRVEALMSNKTFTLTESLPMIIILTEILASMDSLVVKMVS